MLWTVQLEGGPPHREGAVVTVGKKIFQFGTNDTDERPDEIYETCMKVFVLDSTTNRWQEIYDRDQDWPMASNANLVAARGDEVFLVGGCFEKRRFSNLHIFNTKFRRWSKRVVIGRDSAPLLTSWVTFCTVGDCMYVFSSGSSTDQQYLPDVHRLDMSTVLWSVLQCQGRRPVVRYGHTVTAIGDRIFVLGGSCWSSFSEIKQLDYLDTTSDTWHRTPVTTSSEIPEGRHFHSAVDVNGKLLVFGGVDRVDQHLNDLWLMDPETWSWSRLRPLGRGPSPRQDSAVLKIGRRIFVYGGWSLIEGESYVRHKDLFVLDLQPSLKTLCLRQVIDEGLKTDGLPEILKDEIKYMTRPNDYYQD